MIGSGALPSDGGRLFRWRAGMLAGCALEFLLFTVAVRGLAPSVQRMLGTCSEEVLWLSHNYWIAVVVWVAFLALAWFVMRFDGWERIVTVLAIVLHLFALGGALLAMISRCAAPL